MGYMHRPVERLTPTAPPRRHVRRAIRRGELAGLGAGMALSAVPWAVLTWLTC
jgi:hypothetical protein